MGLSQQQAAVSAGISLSTLQKIEAEQVSPCMETVESLLASLKLEFQISPAPADWNSLSALGVPLSVEKTSKVKPSREQLLGHLQVAIGALTIKQLKTSREGFALQGTILALKLHYPSLFKVAFKKQSHC